MKVLSIVGSALVLLVALSASTAAAQTAPAASSEIERHIRRVEAGLVPDVVIQGDTHAAHTLSDRMKELNVPGVSVAVLHNGQIEWARGFGVIRVGGPAVNPDTMFQAGSISKPLAAMAALRLVEQRKVALDADINTYLATWTLPTDAVQGGKPVTLRELLTHTGGTTVHGFPGYASTEPVPTLVQVLNGEKPANTPPIRSEAAPGARWNYSGGGFTIMQQAVLDITREPFSTLLHDTVLVPIGMTRSTYEQPLPEGLRGNAATPYRRDGKPVAGGAHTYPEMAAAGLWTTPSDILRYAVEVEKSLDGKANHVLSAAMTREMLKAGLGSWGLGLQIGGAEGNRYFSHGGVNEGFVNIFAAYEKNGEGAAVMTNSDAGGTLGNEILHAIAAEYHWADWHPIVRTTVQVDPKVLEQYTGTYELPPGRDLVVTLENGQLMIEVAGQNRVPIYAESETKFFPLFPGEIEFVKDDQGRVSSLILHQVGQDLKAAKK